MDKRSERMLEEILKIPGNERCADCKGPAPRWASVNLGIFICVGCATVHRKLGTHKSRVKSVTLDTWSREHLNGMREMGNTASNAIWNPDERRNPPPTSSAGSDDRDGDIEKFIRRKYEQGAFKAGAKAGMAAPTSMNRARIAAGQSASGSGVERQGVVRSTSWTNPNSRNPELNDVLFSKEKDLPRLPKQQPTVSSITSQHSGPSQPPRQRPTPSRSTTPQATGNSMGGGSLIDLGEGTSATVPLQVTGYGGGGMLNGGMQGYQQQMGTSWGNSPNSSMSTSPFQQHQQYQQYQQPQQAYSHPSPSFTQQYQNPQQFSSGSYNPQPQMAFQQPQSMEFQQQSYLPVPQQYGNQMMGSSPNNGMGYSGMQQGMGASPGHGMMQNGSWQGNGGMGVMNGMGTVYGQAGQGMR